MLLDRVVSGVRPKRGCRSSYKVLAPLSFYSATLAQASGIRPRGQEELTPPVPIDRPSAPDSDCFSASSNTHSPYIVINQLHYLIPGAGPRGTVWPFPALTVRGPGRAPESIPSIDRGPHHSYGGPGDEYPVLSSGFSIS